MCLIIGQFFLSSFANVAFWRNLFNLKVDCLAGTRGPKVCLTFPNESDCFTSCLSSLRRLEPQFGNHLITIYSFFFFRQNSYRKKLAWYSQYGHNGRGEETEEDVDRRSKEWPSKRPDKSKSRTVFKSLAGAPWNKSQTLPGLPAVGLVRNITWLETSCVAALTWCLAVQSGRLANFW